MNSLRMCVVCREMKEKADLIRVVKIKDEEMKIDLTFKAQGRGAYVCKSRNCIENAKKRRAFERAFRKEVPVQFYESLEDMVNE